MNMNSFTDFVLISSDTHHCAVFDHLCIVGYYDKNIMPLLSFLNLVSISILTLDGDKFFQRGLMCLNIAFVEINLDVEPNKRPEMNQRSGGRTSVPQIFFSNSHIGGYTELEAHLNK